MRESLKELRQRQYVGVTELAAAAARLIDVYVPAQERGTVSEVPDERMVRYYLTEGLLSPAIGRQGTASLYGWLHLLQLVMIKRLQADHLPIRKIRELLDGRSEKELEAWLGIEENAPAGGSEMTRSIIWNRCCRRLPASNPTGQSRVRFLIQLCRRPGRCGRALRLNQGWKFIRRWITSCRMKLQPGKRWLAASSI